MKDKEESTTKDGQLYLENHTWQDPGQGEPGPSKALGTSPLGELRPDRGGSLQEEEGVRMTM